MKRKLFYKCLSFLYRSLEIRSQQVSNWARPLLFLFLFLFPITMLGILLREYRFFCAQSQKMIALQQQYHTYLAKVKKVVDKSAKNGPPFVLSAERSAVYRRGQTDYNAHNIGVTAEDFTIADTYQTATFFLVVNRHPEYLKQSMLEYFKMQQLGFLLPHIDQQEWLDYSDQMLLATLKNDNFSSKQKTKKRKQSTKIISCVWPINQQSFWLSSLFGPRKKTDGSWGFHHGIDMAAMKGTPIKAAHTGNVMEAGYVTGYGNTIVIQYNKSFKTRYAHLDAIYVYKGQKIKKGNNIGTVGDTGFVRKSGKDGSHLHFEVYKNGKQVNPLYSLSTIC